MNAMISPLCSIVHRWFVGVAVSALLFASAGAAEISGRYSDKGTRIPSENEKDTAEVSLHGLLSLEFDPAIAALNFQETSTVEIRQSDDVFEVRIFDKEGKVRWNGQWKKGVEYTPEGNRAALRLRAADGKEPVALVFEPIDNRMLQVEASRITSGPLGPGTQKIGVYLFARE
jgi:hypothetical protein